MGALCTSVGSILNKIWKDVAWNGIRFKTPADWDVSQIGTRHLIIDDQSGPAMELKWGPVKGTFSHKTHLKRIAALQSRRNRVRVAKWLLPPHWQKALADFENSGFLWQGQTSSGRGAILYCPVCRIAALVQFFRGSSAEREKTLLAVLRSYRDHSQADRILWSIYDIRVTLPKKLSLLRFRFEAGKYELVFSTGKQTIHLHRWAPAAALLGGRDLSEFAKTIPEFAKDHPNTLNIGDRNMVEWSIAPNSGWQQKISSLKITPSYFWYRLWYLEEQNRILGVRAESKRNLDLQLLNKICADYESL